MYKRSLLFITLMLAGLAWLTAQTTAVKPCGVEGALNELLKEKLLRTKLALQESPAVQNRNITYVPVTFLLVARTNGTGRINTGTVLDQLCALNEDFLDLNVQFYIKQLKEVNNNSIYDNPGGATPLMTSFRDAGSINIWIANNATSANAPQPPGVITAGYYDPAGSRDWLVVNQDFIGSDDVTLAHEVGHFFFLAHPHSGWEEDPWEPGDPNPVGNFAPDGSLTERMNGSNCENAGDFVCDTPPDYNGVFWPDCDYTGALDPDGTPIDPDESNFMSYFGNCPPDAYHFSDMQQAIMVQSLMSSSRAYVRPGVTPPLANVTEAPDLIFPEDNGLVEGFNAVNFQWTAVDGADRYLLEIDDNTDFSGSGYLSLVVFGSSKVIEDLDANETYYWRVTPFNTYRTCAPISQRWDFDTGNVVSTSELRQVSEWSVTPNPAGADGELSVRLEASQGFEGQLLLYGLNGQLVRDGGRQRIEAGNNRLRLPLQGISAGVYLLSLQAGDRQLTTRVIITN